MKNTISVDNLKGDIIVGVFYGVAFIFLNIIGVFNLAIPPVLNLFSTQTYALIVIVLIAPIVEETFFRGVLYSYFLNITKGKKTLSKFLQALSFGLFHLFAYVGIAIEVLLRSEDPIGSIYVVSGAFISAILFGFIGSFVVEKRKNLLTWMITHGIVNAWLVQGVLVVVKLQ